MLFDHLSFREEQADWEKSGAKMWSPGGRNINGAPQSVSPSGGHLFCFISICCSKWIDRPFIFIITSLKSTALITLAYLPSFTYNHIFCCRTIDITENTKTFYLHLLHLISQPALVSPQLSELTNSLANLKWGFRKRETELLGQIDQYKKMTVQLHGSQKKLRTSLR